MQNDNIINKARRLGLDATDVNKIAAQVGVDSSDLDTLENILDERLEEQSINQRNLVDTHNKFNPGNLDNSSFGEREYNQAKNQNGGFDNNYYSNRGKDLDKKVEDAEQEKNNSQKEQIKKNDNGEEVRSLKNKNIFDKVKDNANLLKAKNDRIQNKISNAKANAYRMSHPKEVVKDKVSETAKEGAKKIGQKASETGKQVAKQTGKALLAFIKKNPYVLGVILIVFFIILLLLFLMGVASNSNYFQEECDIFPMNDTRLSRDDFIIKLTEYFQNEPKEYGDVFLENAGNIYDISISNNINPELVVVRAIAEGGSPGKETNNYWGIKCYNGQDSCETYESFDLGVLSFIEIVAEYETVTEMMQRYAYIGDYWYNPGSSSLGGCYYFPYIRSFMSENRAFDLELVCEESKKCYDGTQPSCTETTEEDQEAYAEYNVSIMADLREKIFGLEPEVCDKFNAECALYNQWDSKWGYIHLGSSAANMSKYGCAVTALAIGISCSGTDLTVENFDAGLFVRYLNQGNCFDIHGNINWTCKAISDVAPAVKHVTRVNFAGKTTSEKNAIIDSYNDGHHFIILHNNVQGHFVVYSSTASLTYEAMDPNGGKIAHHAISAIDRIEVFEY